MHRKINVKEITLYIIIGSLTTAISLSSYFLLKQFLFIGDTQLNIQISTIISWLLCVTFAYFANRNVVFKSKEKRVVFEASKFYLSRVLTLVIDSLAMFVLTDMFCLKDDVSKLLVQIIIFILNYLFSKFAVFKKKD